MLTTAWLYVNLLWDVLIGFINVGFGGLLPKLYVPPTPITGKTAIVTGSNSGIGYQLALDLAKRGATVYLACRNTEKAQEAKESINEAVKLSNGDSKGANVHVMSLDTSSMESVRRFAEAWDKEAWGKQIDILMHNAGIGSSDKSTTSEGLGSIYATNLLGSFLLTSLLEPHLAPKARVIFTSSTGQYVGNLKAILTSPHGVRVDRKIPDSEYYTDTKLMQVAFATLLQRRWDHQKRDATAHAFSPGYTFTPIFGKMPTLPFMGDPLFWVLKAGTFLSIPVQQGAATGLWLATTEDASVRKGGGYWDRMARKSTPVDLMEDGVLERVWQCWEKDSGATWH